MTAEGEGAPVFAELSVTRSYSVVRDAGARPRAETTTVLREGLWSEVHRPAGSQLFVADGLHQIRSLRAELGERFELVRGPLAELAARREEELDRAADVDTTGRDLAAAVAGQVPADLAVMARAAQTRTSRVVLTNRGELRSFAVAASHVLAEVGAPEAPPRQRARVAATTTSGIDGLGAAHEAVVADALRQWSPLATDREPMPVGELPVVFAPRAAAVFIHETIGHALEADNLGRTSVPLLARMGTPVASSALSVQDGGTRPELWGAAPFDDEGTPTGTSPLLDEGVLVGVLSSLEHDGGTGATTGNGRRHSYRHYPLPRISQIAALPGRDDPAEMVAGLTRGVYVEELSWGYLQPSDYTFRLLPRRGRVISGGRLGGYFSGGVIRGDMLASLGMVDAVGTDIGWASTFCFKHNQELACANGSPALAIGRLTVSE